MTPPVFCSGSFSHCLSSTEKDKSLFFSITHNHIEKIKELITAKVSLSSKNQKGETPLILAAKKGNVAVIDLLLESGAGATINDFDETKRTALTAAVLSGSLESVERLIAHRSLPLLVCSSVQDVFGMTPLMLAIKGGCTSIAKTLIQYELEFQNPPKFDLSNREGQTALLLAIKVGNLEVVSALIQTKKPLNFQKLGPDQLPALHLAVLNKKIEIVKEMRRYYRGDALSCYNGSGFTALCSAIEKKAYPFYRFLASRKSVVVQTRGGWSPLHLAAANGDRSLVRLLIRKNKKSLFCPGPKNGCTPLHLAAQNGHLAVCKILIGRGIISFARKATGFKPLHLPRTDTGFTPLHLAAQNGHVAIVEVLARLDSVFLNVRSTEGWAPLHLAVRHNQEKVVEKLLRCPGIDPDIKNKQGVTPLDVARRFGYEKIIALLERKLILVFSCDGVFVKIP